MEINNSVLDQIKIKNIANKPVLNSQYEKFFKETKVSLDDIVLEQWEMNQYNKTTSNAIEHMALDISDMKDAIIPFLKKDESAIVFTDSFFTEAKKLKFFDDNVVTPLLDGLKKTKDDIAVGNARDVVEIKPEKIIDTESSVNMSLIKIDKDLISSSMFLQESNSILEKIDKSTKAVADYFHSTERSKKGSVGETYKNSKDSKDSIGSVGSSVISSAIGGVLGGAAKLIGGISGVQIAADLASVYALYEFLTGFADDELASKLTGKKIENLNVWDKIDSGITNIISLGGVFDKKETYDNIKKFEESVSEVWSALLNRLPPTLKKNVTNFTDSISEYTRNFVEDLYSQVKGESTADFFVGVAKEAADLSINLISLGLVRDLDDLTNKMMSLGTMIFAKIESITKSFIDILPDSIKNFISKTYDSTLKPMDDKLNSSLASLTPVPIQLDTSTAEKSQNLAAQERNFYTEKEDKPQQPIIINQPAQSSPTPSVTRSVSSGREEINRALNKGLQFGL